MPKYLDGTGLQALCERLNTSFIKTNAFSRAININTVAGENTVTIPSDFLTSDEYDSMVVFLDGLRLVKNSDYTFNSSTRVLTFVDTFITGDVVTVGIYTNGYDEVASASFPALSAGVLTSDGTNMSWKNFTKMVYTQDITSANESVIIPQANLNNAVVTEVFRNGLLMVETDDYSINLSTREITFVVPLVVNEKIVVITQNAIVNSSSIFSGASIQDSTANTPASGDNSTKIATTAYVQNNLNNYVDLSSEQTITGRKNFMTSFHLTNDTSWQDIVKFNGEPVTGDYNRVGSIRFITDSTTQKHTVQLNAITKGVNDTNATFGTISVSILPDKTVTTYAPTPATSDNSTKIATTAYVNNKFANPIEKVNAITSAASITIDPNSGSLFTLTLGVNSSITIGNLSGGPYATNGATITLYLTNTNKTISWNSKITWVSGEAPDVTSNPSIITFVTFNGGTKWYGSSIEVKS